MSEVTFAKGFLTTLDKREIKLPADHVSDPRQHPNQSPAHPFPRKSSSDNVQAQSKTVTVTIKPMRAGSTVTLTSIPLDHSIYDIKTQYAQQISLPLDKIKLLLNKKPAADLKTLKDLGIDGNVDMTAMLMGGAVVEAAPITSTAAATPTSAIDTPSVDKMEVDSEAAHSGSEKAQVQAEEAVSGPSGPGALHTIDFWNDLEAFLTQRLRDKAEAGKLSALFKQAWAQQ